MSLQLFNAFTVEYFTCYAIKGSISPLHVNTLNFLKTRILASVFIEAVIVKMSKFILESATFLLKCYSTFEI